MKTNRNPSRTGLLLLGVVGFLIGAVIMMALVSNAPAGTPSYFMSCTPGNYYVGKLVYHWECR